MCVLYSVYCEPILYVLYSVYCEHILYVLYSVYCEHILCVYCIVYTVSSTLCVCVLYAYICSDARHTIIVKILARLNNCALLNFKFICG